ncbi:ABC transporter permease [Lacrimispora defluvii]|uniref:ABC transporter permease subunit n=1 Tax=Lacrimispora defluvii TaxID=2719233 RepID=A0ABX1VR48_9FIRM|nr:ABC transporter permease [Lacrimispora defluvii]NNJ30289.1 ABC transporter permease subunit [Lacrimispora defluvii]
MKGILLEFYKIRKRKIWVIILVLLGVQCLWGMWAFRDMNAKKLSQGYMQCLYHFSVLNTIMMPMIAAITASKICDLEHKGQTFKLLLTVMPAGALFDAKFICATMYMVAVGAAQTIFIIALGRTAGFTEPFPAGFLLYYFIITISVTVVILAIQQVFSLLFANQMVSFVIGITGSFAGLFSLFLPQNVQKGVLWSYYGVLTPVRMNWDSQTRIADLQYIPVDWSSFCLLMGLFAVIYFTGRRCFTRKER